MCVIYINNNPSDNQLVKNKGNYYLIRTVLLGMFHVQQRNNVTRTSTPAAPMCLGTCSSSSTWRFREERRAAIAKTMPRACDARTKAWEIKKCRRSTRTHGNVTRTLILCTRGRIRLVSRLSRSSGLSRALSDGTRRLASYQVDKWLE